ncbi:unnamed protein product, partial [Discosporangium mesarthrocarpum]
LLVNPSDPQVASVLKAESIVGGTPNDPDSRLPHVVVFLVDDLGFNDVGWANDDFVGLTPNIERLKGIGVELTSYYTQQLCTPARAAVLTGKYPFRTGTQYEVIQPTESWGLPLNYTLMPEFFKDMGYRTHAVGKWHLGHGYRDLLPHKRGFDTFYGFLTDQVSNTIEK